MANTFLTPVYMNPGVCVCVCVCVCVGVCVCACVCSTCSHPSHHIPYVPQPKHQLFAGQKRVSISISSGQAGRGVFVSGEQMDSARCSPLCCHLYYRQECDTSVPQGMGTKEEACPLPPGPTSH